MKSYQRYARILVNTGKSGVDSKMLKSDNFHFLRRIIKEPRCEKTGLRCFRPGCTVTVTELEISD